MKSERITAMYGKRLHELGLTPIGGHEGWNSEGVPCLWIHAWDSNNVEVEACVNERTGEIVVESI